MRCLKCNTEEPVVGFDRDDPILGCGHVKKLTTKVDLCSELVQGIFGKMPLSLVSTRRKVQTAYCPNCKKEVLVVKDKGQSRCAGDMIVNSGCGRVLLVNPVSLRCD